MKKKLHALVFLLVFVLASCGKHYTHHPEILAAEKCLASSPDSSLRLLLSVPSPQALPEADRAAWCLHYAHAMYKLMKETAVPDSLLEVAAKYFEGSGLNKYSGTAYYLKGCYAESHKKPHKALLYYKKALLLLENTQEYDIRGLAALNLIYVYKSQNLIEESQKYMFMALRDFTVVGNKERLLFLYAMKGDFYFYTDAPLDSTLLYYQKAQTLAHTLKILPMYYYLQGQTGFALCNAFPKKAIPYFLSAYPHDLGNRHSYNLFLAYSYAHIQRPDSAAYFFSLVEKANIAATDSLPYFATRSYIDETKRDYPAAYEDLKKAYILNEKDLREKTRNQLYRIDKQYDLTEKQKENLELKITNRNKELVISAMVILLLGASIFFLIIRNKSKRRQAELKTKNKKLQYEMELRKLESKQKHDLLLSKLKQKLDLTLEFRRIQDRPVAPEKQEELMARIIRTVILHKSEWDYYVEVVDELSKNRLKRMQEDYKELTKNDLIVIVLIYLGISITDSCILLGMSKETMYTRRKRIRKHLELQEQTELEEWLSTNLKPEYGNNPAA